MIVHSSTSSASTCSPARRSRRAELLDEVAAGEALGLGIGVHLRALQHQGGGHAVGRGRRGVARRSASRPPPRTTTRATRSSPRRYATTMHRLTGGRFTLGLGRGIAPLFDAYGIPRITTAQIEDFVGLMRRLWHGEVIFGHDGPAGNVPGPAPRLVVRRGHPARLRRVRAELARARRARASTRSCCTRSSPTRRSSAASRTVRERRRAGRPRSGVGAHLVVLRDDRRPSARGRSG